MSNKIQFLFAIYEAKSAENEVDILQFLNENFDIGLSNYERRICATK